MTKRIHVCEVTGNDAEGIGTEKMPFKTLLKAVEFLENNMQDVEVLHRKVILEPYEPCAKTTLKKAIKTFEINAKKIQKEKERLEKENELKKVNQEMENLKLEQAKNIVLKQDMTLEKASKIKIDECSSMRGKRIKVSGWVHRLRTQGKMMFVVLRDGYGFLQCVFTGDLSCTFDALSLTLESTICVYGVLQETPEGKSAPGGHELQCDYWELISKAPGGDDAIGNKINQDCNPKILLDQRHLVLRGDIASSCIRFRALALKAFRDFFDKRKVTEVTPPLMGNTLAEGGSEVFKIDYYGSEVLSFNVRLI
jgi:asparaginyl-tRNA synthetase